MYVCMCANYCLLLGSAMVPHYCTCAVPSHFRCGTYNGPEPADVASGGMPSTGCVSCDVRRCRPAFLVSVIGQTYGRTALVVASQCGHVDVVMALVNAGAAVNQVMVRDGGQCTPSQLCLSTCMFGQCLG